MRPPITAQALEQVQEGFNAFFDSGNRLKEPASGRPVIILEREIIKEELHNTQEIFFKTAK